MIRITLVRREWLGWNGRVIPASTVVKEFADVSIAADWFVNDSYFDEPYIASALWQRIDADDEGGDHH